MTKSRATAPSGLRRSSGRNLWTVASSSATDVGGFTMPRSRARRAISFTYRSPSSSLDRRARLVPRAVGREADEVRRLEESTEGVLAVARVLGDAGHRVGMKHLDEQGSESADQHRRKIAVDRSRNAVEGEVRLFGVVATRWWLLRQADGPADIAIDAPTQLR